MSNRRNYDSTFCGSLPLHQINLIQPHGALIVLSNEYRVIQVSENIEDMLGLQPAKLLHSEFSDYVPANQFQQLLETCSMRVQKIPLRFSFSAGASKSKLVAQVVVKDEFIILELEIIPPGQPAFSAFTDVYQQLKFAMAAVEAAATIQEVCETAVKELKKLSGFDKIMIYRFDKDWNGAVLAEAMEPGMEAYLGLVFPASDIPKQARQLYLTNPYRLIPNREYSPVKLYPVINPVTNGFLDLSDVGIRAVASVHLEYMKNMGIKASMSTRLLNHDNSLWGLISCHHLEPKYLNYEVCTIFELLSTIISAKIIALQSKEEYGHYSGYQQVQSELARQVYSENDLVSGLMHQPTSLLQLLNADGVVIKYNKRLETKGSTPSKDEIEDLLLWLRSLDISKVYHEESLSDIYERAAGYASVASGLMVIPIQPLKGDYILFFRQEVIQKISWGGNPEEAIQFEKQTQNYHPRNSFRIWQQTVARTSLPWKSYEVKIAEQFRNFMLEYIVTK
jgi:light-regulated signal transduction histidine kinase (bacteriophytochrome)